MVPLDPEIRILLVDDYRTMLRIMRTVLGQIGCHNVDETTDGATALQFLAERDYALVICDWNMEPMSGLELLRRVRADERLQGLPFIMVTADGHADKVLAARDAGVSDYIIKPFNGATLRAKMAAALEAAQ